MLHQPTPRTDLAVWRGDAAAVVSMIGADAVVVGGRFADAELTGGLPVKPVTVDPLLDGDDVDPVRSGEEYAALLQLSSRPCWRG